MPSSTTRLPPKSVVKLSAPPETKEVLADAILKISVGVTSLIDSGLNRKAIVVLLRDATGLGKRDIEMVLDALKNLSRDYTR
jgi:hypothetical protein